MIRDRVKEYFIDKDYNCAESLLRAANDEYELQIPEESFKLVSAFGAGMGCGKVCGALCSCMAVIGKMSVTDRAHATEGFTDLCADLYDKFVRSLGNTICEDLKKLYRNDEVRCLKAVEMAADVLDNFIAANNLSR
ncbi:MAG TPA: C-GCAxxG-C-C family (seleno)protein [Sedimentibacter sp.]|jgi:C_GCAxxG_C_C family probable redox protein|nr:C-GCAxxG-C-C family protein [Sedimentibacter sp.]HRC81081.1 C-GCAxxG-C-C family (seleno)protein [Sedimentibacter sp.]